MRRLTPKQKLFAEAYASHGDKLEAAIFAGYSNKSASTQCCQLLKNKAIISQITQLKLKEAQKKPITPTKEFSKDEFVGYALRDYEALPVEEANRPRFLELAGKGAGILGAKEESNTTKNLTMINVKIGENASQTELWEMARKLLNNI